MPKETLDEREFELVNIVGAQIADNQRDLSRYMDISLGTINMLIRRLVTKGYIRTKQLNQKKVEYILTPKGFAEKMRKSIKYTLKTISSISLIKNRLKEPLGELINKGERNFYILGESDFAVLVEYVLKEICHDPFTISHIETLPKDSLTGTVLICREDSGEHVFNGKSVNLVEILANDYDITKSTGGLRG